MKDKCTMEKGKTRGHEALVGLMGCVGHYEGWHWLHSALTIVLRTSVVHTKKGFVALRCRGEECQE